MSASTHLKHLVDEHQRLDHQIQEAFNHFQPDSNITQLKKHKLSIKEKIHALKSRKDS